MSYIFKMHFKNLQPLIAFPSRSLLMTQTRTPTVSWRTAWSHYLTTPQLTSLMCSPLTAQAAGSPPYGRRTVKWPGSTGSTWSPPTTGATSNCRPASWWRWLWQTRMTTRQSSQTTCTAARWWRTAVQVKSSSPWRPQTLMCHWRTA